MSRRLGGVPKARGHIQGGKSYKTGVLQHPIALQRSDCQSHVKRAKGTSLRPDRIICKLIALRHVPTPGHINLPEKNLDAACVRPQKKGKLSTSRRSTRYRCFGQDLTELAGSWPCRTYPTAKIQPFSFSAKNFYRSRNEKSRPGAIKAPGRLYYCRIFSADDLFRDLRAAPDNVEFAGYGSSDTLPAQVVIYCGSISVGGDCRDSCRQS